MPGLLPSDTLTASAPSLPAWPVVDAIVDRALEEDLASGDPTSEACVDASLAARGIFVARSDLVVAGLAVAARVFERLDRHVEVVGHGEDGARVARGTPLMEVSGNARVLLAGERVALNLLQRMSGVASRTRSFVDALPAGTGTRIADTRKTTPGLRALERYAVRCGGGHNHRDSLGSAVLIKDNHIVAGGGVAASVRRVRARAPHTSRIECEVESLTQLDEALAAEVDVVLLDNMDDAMIDRALARIRSETRRIVVEVSGRIALARVATLARAGVDVISVGALTHSAPAADVALDLRL